MNESMGDFVGNILIGPNRSKELVFLKKMARVLVKCFYLCQKMTLPNLRSLYKSIREHNSTYALFDFKINKVLFHVFFDISTSPFKLGFIVLNERFNLWIDVWNGFRINPFIEPGKFKELVKLMKLNSNPNKRFSTSDFFREFNDKVPSSYLKPSKSVLVRIVTSQYTIEDENKIYYLGLRVWENRLRTFENSEKTRLLYPEIYERIKYRNNISVCYTSIKLTNEDEVIGKDLEEV